MQPRIAVVGDRNLSHHSHCEIDAALARFDADSQWVATPDATDVLGSIDGLWVAPGSPYVDANSVVAAIRFAREGGVPFLGTCSGMHYTVIEYLRNCSAHPRASHEEADGASPDNAVVALACSLQGEIRLIEPLAGSLFYSLVGGRTLPGMHYCSYAPTASSIAALTDTGFRVGACSRDGGAEVIELPGHPFFVASLFQPQIGASSGEPLHPLLRAFTAAATAHARDGHQSVAELMTHP
jgi:CTP synthase (UTP-ammonia lyase)